MSPWTNGKDWRTWRKKYLMTDGCMWNKELGKIKMIIDIGKFGDTKILIDTDDKLAEVTLTNIVVLISCVKQDDGNFYP